MTNEKLNNYDVFHSFLVKNADYEGYIELPKLKTSNFIPEKLISFSKAMSKTWTDFDCWVMFYEHDIKFERLWRNPKQYLSKLKKFKGNNFAGFQFISQYAALYADVEYIQR